MVSGDLLREARKRAGLSQAELARRAGTHRSAVGRWERGGALPSLETLQRLIRVCGLELGFRLSQADEAGHDLALIRRALTLTPAERFLHNQRAVRSIRGVWQGARPARHG